MNPSLLSYLQQNHDLIIKKFRKLGTEEIVEDAISSVKIKLLSRDYFEVSNVPAFINQAIANFMRTYRRNNRRYDLDYDTKNFKAFCYIDVIEENQDLAWRISELMSAVDTLTKGQKRAIYTFLETGRVTNPELGIVNTQKALYLQAVRALRVKFSDAAALSILG